MACILDKLKLAGVSRRDMYHTQERRDVNLTEPCWSEYFGAWLGPAYYFWLDLYFAKAWGVTYKNSTGVYQVYKAEIDCTDVLDTVFNEEHYKFWLEAIDRTANDIHTKTGKKASLTTLNRALKEKGTLDGVSGIMFQDIPKNDKAVKVEEMYYRKRIQLGAFRKSIINNFALHLETSCSKKIKN